jgi:hypothetical protein
VRFVSGTAMEVRDENPWPPPAVGDADAIEAIMREHVAVAGAE